MENEKQIMASTFFRLLLQCIIVVGIVGNIINLIVFSKRSMRQTSTFRFLFYLSAADLLVIVVCCSDLLLRFNYNIDIRSYSWLSCRLHTFFTYFLTHISSFILMVISVDRALVISNKSIYALVDNLINKRIKSADLSNEPASLNNQTTSQRRSVARTFSLLRFHFNKRLFNIHRVDKLILLIAIGLILLNLHYLIYMDLNIINETFQSALRDLLNSISQGLLNANNTSIMKKPVFFNNTLNQKKNVITLIVLCFPKKGTKYHSFLQKAWIWIDICLYALIPFVVMSICSAVILIRIRKKSRTYFTKLINQKSPSSQPNFIRRLRRNRQLMYMLLITNLYFFISVAPYCISFIVMKGKRSANTNIQLLVHIFSYMNNATNFLLYGFSSQKYREELMSVFCNKKNHNLPNIQQLTYYTQQDLNASKRLIPRPN
jgi:hypothetical protein